MSTSDRLTIEECEDYVDTPDNKYFINVNIVLRQLADTMRENERLKKALVEIGAVADLNGTFLYGLAGEIASDALSPRPRNNAP